MILPHIKISNNKIKIFHKKLSFNLKICFKRNFSTISIKMKMSALTQGPVRSRVKNDRLTGQQLRSNLTKGRLII